MSTKTMSPKERAYGRTIQLPVVRPAKRFAVFAGMLAAFAIAGWIALPAHSASATAVSLSAIGLLACAGFVLHVANRIHRFEDAAITLTRAELRLPAYPLRRGYHVEVPLETLEGVEKGFAGNVPTIVIDGEEGRYVLPSDWLPPGWTASDLAVRILVRARFARASLDDVGALAAVEAQVEHSIGIGAVVIVHDQEPEVIAVIHDVDEYAALVGEPGFPLDEHRFYVNDDHVSSVRAELDGKLRAFVATMPKG